MTGPVDPASPHPPSDRAVAARRHAVALATACVDREDDPDLLRSVLSDDDADYRAVSLALGGMIAELVRVIAAAKQEEPLETLRGIALVLEQRSGDQP